MSDAPATVFVYGTLTEPTRVDDLLDNWEYDGPAVLAGFRRVDGRYPTLEPGGKTTGRLLVTADLETVDSYEGVDDGLYVRVAVPLISGDVSRAPRPPEARDPRRLGIDRAWLYVGDPTRLDAAADWPGDGAFPARVRQHVRTAGVTVRRVDGP